MSWIRRARASIYDAVITGMTSQWYAAVLERVPHGAHLLDVGIGTGAALLANSALVRAKDLRVTGVDIDASYVERCRELVARTGLGDRVVAQIESIYDHRGGPYDAVYFSGSFMLLPRPVEALRHVQTLLRPGGRVYFTQTFEHRWSPVLETVKPLLRLVTTIDFGSVTYEAEFRRAVESAGMSIESQATLHGASHRSSMLVVAAPSAESPSR